MNKQEWYQKSGEETVNEWGSHSERGLERTEVTRRQEQCNNELAVTKKSHPALMFFKQFTDTMVLVLLAATVVSGLVGAMTDA
ncbi:MAG: cation-transporting P-type ATPase, partial [Ignavibacteriales bacterium]